MITLLRKIRQRLLTENKFTKYLIYALGEIILVVIGILIALQINNWNEENKINKSIENHLVILKQNLLEDQTQLKQLRGNMEENIEWADSLMLQIRTIVPLNNKVKKYMVKLILEYQFSPNTNAIETITQSNEIPSLPPELQTAVLNYYALIEQTKEREHISNTQIQTKYENRLNNEYPEVFQKDNVWDFMANYYANDPRPTTAINQEKLLSDKTFEALLVSRYYQSITLEDFYSQLLESSDIILKLLDEDASKK